MTSLTLLLVADLHYTNRAGPQCGEPNRLGRHALEWLRSAVQDARASGPLDGVVLLGDLIDRAGAPGAEEDLAEIARFLADTGLPARIVPGNHDPAPDRTLQTFGDRLGASQINGYVLYTFAERYDSITELPVRPAADLEAFRALDSAAPLLAFQHPPLYPPVDCSGYPFMPSNTGAILDAYERRGVLLSASGHYHEGGEPAMRNGVAYLTCAALAEAPFSYYLASVRGRTVRVERRTIGVTGM